MDESFCRLKGKKVCDEKIGKCYGRLSDILVNKGTNEILGIISTNDSFVYKNRLFNREDIISSDETSIYVKGFGEKFVKVIPIEDYQSCENDIYKRKAVLTDGRNVGKIQNMNFDLETGIMTEFEIGSSIAEDLLKGRKICRTRDTISFSDGKIILEEKLTDSVERKKILF
ncbi:MAG: PRC-barrel domain-containing protein [Clostridia bacterium]